ncbi:FAD:protein FMN transferase [uncultured Sphingobacterium sp.]|uniref:FAD:protein FMN transferase n=1 Tax=uncultured Sphingobacterium sp. TaxID=182688 RepID=UPI0025D5F9D3|nr:FAD:protein FMN transferase [uncultured Sphingobacterium sp.]
MKKEFRRALRLMGNHFELTVVEDAEDKAAAHIDAAIAEIQRIEKLLTTFNEDSQTNLINRHAGICPVKIDREVYELIERSLRISRLTDGYFDISYGSIDKSLWNFDRGMPCLPDPKIVQQNLSLVNYNNILLDPKKCTVYLVKRGMCIGFGGIGKGYAAEMGKRLLQQRGVESGVVNASGDLTVWGSQADGKPWTIGIANPEQSSLPFSYMNITDTAIATSGNYEKFVLIDGKKYSHTINPKTGMPINGVKSVTIICPNAEIADALATPITIMGVQNGIALINQIQQVECIIIDDDNNIFSSNKINFK